MKMAAAKRKRLTNREKTENARIKKELQQRGIIPPDKPKLNRKKFIEEARQEWNGRDAGFYAWEAYLFEAVSIMLGHTERGAAARASLEAVGVAKCLKLAIRLRKFHQAVKDRGDDRYKIKEQYDYIKDILDA